MESLVKSSEDHILEKLLEVVVTLPPTAADEQNLSANHILQNAASALCLFLDASLCLLVETCSHPDEEETNLLLATYLC